MRTFGGFDDIEKDLAQRFAVWNERGNRRPSSIVGFVVARPAVEFVQKHILDSVNYWHHRSDLHTTFYWLGYVRSSGIGGSPVTTVDGRKWIFDDVRLSVALEEIEDRTRWRYSGGTELLLANARFEQPGRSVFIDFGSAVSFDLEMAFDRNPLNSPNRIIECIFSFARNVNENMVDLTRDLAHSWVLRTGRRTIRDFVASYIPAPFEKGMMEAVAFSARDLSK